jgi:cbb3-type cytochrome oxidase subunit 3
MRETMMETLAQYSGIAGLAAFFCIFTFMAIRLYRPGAKKAFERFAHIPLDEDAHG